MQEFYIAPRYVLCWKVAIIVEIVSNAHRPLSDMLSLLKPRSHVSGGFTAGGDWSIQFPRSNGIKCYAVTSGACWLVVDGVLDPVFLKSGDGFLLRADGLFGWLATPNSCQLTPRHSTLKGAKAAS